MTQNSRLDAPQGNIIGDRVAPPNWRKNAIHGPPTARCGPVLRMPGKSCASRSYLVSANEPTR